LRSLVGCDFYRVEERGCQADNLSCQSNGARTTGGLWSRQAPPFTEREYEVDRRLTQIIDERTGKTARSKPMPSCLRMSFAKSVMQFTVPSVRAQSILLARDLVGCLGRPEE
jgi:hypothetical protein